MLRSYKVLGDKVSTINRDAFLFYKELAKNRDKKKINETRHYSKIISSIYKKVADGVVEYEGGVYAKNMFYIIPQPWPQKNVVRITNGKELRGTMNLHTDSKVYSIFFINLFVKTRHKVWDMHNSFFNSLKKKFSKNLKEQTVKYIFCLDSILKVNKKQK